MNGELTHEADETLTVDLSNESNANLLDPSGLGTITNDDQVPDISIDEQSVTEGNSPDTTTMTFNVTLSNPSDQTVTVDYATSDGTATIVDGDYAAAAGTLTFTAGQTAKTVDVTVNGDLTHESDETFTVGLSNPTNANLLDDSGLGTIQDDDASPTISVGDASVAEGNAGGATLSFDVTLSVASAGVVTVDYTTDDGTANVANSDYDAASGTLTFTAGQTTKTVDVTVHGDQVRSDPTRLVGAFRDGRRNRNRWCRLRREHGHAPLRAGRHLETGHRPRTRRHRVRGERDLQRRPFRPERRHDLGRDRRRHDHER